MLAAADRVLLQLNQQKGNRSKRKAKEEVRSLFNKGKKPKSASKCSWKHKFVCPAYHDQTRIPTTDTEKDDLLQAGLGEKEIVFDDIEISAEDFRDIMYDKYPSLREGGGYNFFKCMPNSRSLEKLSVITLSSPSMLRSRVGN